MQKKIVAIMAVTVLGLSVASVLLWMRLQQTKAAEQQRAKALQAEAQARAGHEERVKEMEREQARLDKQNQELASLTQTLRAKETRQTSNLVALANQLTATATNAGGQAGSFGAKEGFAGMMDKVMKDPAMREMMRGQQKAMMNQMYGPLFKELGLSTEQRQKFMDILLDNTMKSVEHAGSIFKTDPAEKAEAMKSITEQQKEMQGNLKDLLGGEKFAQYEDYQKSIGERMQLNQFRQQLEGTDEPLQDTQVTQLMQIFKEEKTRAPAVLSDDPNRALEAMEAMKSEETMNKHFQQQEELHKRVLARAAGALSAEQLKEYSGFLEQQLSLQRLGTKMARDMFGGKNEVPPVPAVGK